MLFAYTDLTNANSFVALKVQSAEMLSIEMFVVAPFVYPLLDYNPHPRIYGICMGIARFCAEYLSGNLSHPFCSASITQSGSIGHTGF